VLEERPLLRRAKRAVLALAGTFLVLEIAIRVVYALAFPEEALEASPARWIGGQFGAGEDMRDDLAPWERLHQLTRYDDAELLWRNAPSARRRFHDERRGRDVDVFTSSAGFNTPEFFWKQREGSFRVLAVGSSFTFCGYPQQLENLLQWSYPDRAFEVLNCAVPGYTSYQYRRLIDERLPDLTFDVALCDVTSNEFTPAARPDSRQSAATRLSRFLSRSEAFKLVDYVLRRPVWGGASTDPESGGGGAALRVPPEEFEANVRHIATTLASRCGEPVVFLVMNHMPADYLAALERVTRETGARTLNVYGSARELLGNDDWREHFLSHPDGIGNRAVAALVYRQLLEMPSFRAQIGDGALSLERIWNRPRAR